MPFLDFHHISSKAPHDWILSNGSTGRFIYLRVPAPINRVNLISRQAGLLPKPRYQFLVMYALEEVLEHAE